MADPTPQYVRDLSLKTPGEFADFTDGQISNVMEEVVLQYLSMTGEDMYTRVVGLHTAHLLKLALVAGGGNGQGQGQLVAVKVDKLEKRWGQDQKQIAVDGGLDETTMYGRRCLDLLRSRLPAVRSTY